MIQAGNLKSISFWTLRGSTLGFHSLRTQWMHKANCQSLDVCTTPWHTFFQNRIRTTKPAKKNATSPCYFIGLSLSHLYPTLPLFCVHSFHTILILHHLNPTPCPNNRIFSSSHLRLWFQGHLDLPFLRFSNRFRTTSTASGCARRVPEIKSSLWKKNWGKKNAAHEPECSHVKHFCENCY